ncbi:MAG: hypothetical protein ACKVX9_17320 [Blastocatellia bacterium]
MLRLGPRIPKQQQTQRTRQPSLSLSQPHYDFSFFNNRRGPLPRRSERHPLRLRLKDDERLPHNELRIACWARLDQLTGVGKIKRSFPVWMMEIILRRRCVGLRVKVDE